MHIVRLYNRNKNVSLSNSDCHRNISLQRRAAQRRHGRSGLVDGIADQFTFSALFANRLSAQRTRYGPTR